MGLRSGIRKKPIPDPRVKKAPDPGSATLLPDPLVRAQRQAKIVRKTLFLLFCDFFRTSLSLKYDVNVNVKVISRIRTH
jgi:hypothetical protein